MRTKRDQRGSSLVMLIGIVAALAIMATTLVVLTSNVHHNTYVDRMEVKADAVTEAALDVGMADLSATWPVASGTGPTLDATAFRSMFTADQFPGPQGGGSFAQYTYFDNPWPDGTYHSPYSAANPPTYDMNQDSQMYITAQAGVGPGKARIQSLVRVTYFQADFPRGVAVFTGADLLSNGGGNNPKIHVEVAPPTGTVSARAAGDIEEDGTGKKAAVFDQATMIGLEGAAAGTVEDVFPAALRDALVQTAKDHGRYFSGANAVANAAASPPKGTWSAGGLTGLTVIEPSSYTTLSLKGTYNSEQTPGIIILLGGSNLDFGGGGDYYGVLYTQGTVEKGHGSFIVHGMLVCDSTLDMRGTVDIKYNDNCIANLAKRFHSNVMMVPNTWRELKPQ
jgi:hypothetical protein